MEIHQEILKLIDDQSCVSSDYISKTLGQPHQKIVGAIKSLESLGNVIDVKQIITKSWACTDEGKKLKAEGSHEAQLFNYLSSDGTNIQDIKSQFISSSAVALGAALKNKWVKKEGNMIFKCVESIVDSVQLNLMKIDEGSASDVEDRTKVDYKKRKLIKEIDTTTFEITKGENFSLNASKQEAELTKEMIESGDWKNKAFKPFNFNAKGKQEQRSGHLHPLMQLRSEFRQIFLEMGFSEMPTNNYIESAFWNFDALFQPQQHPARDAQDTFYIAIPEKTISVPMDYLEKVKTVHSVGAYDSSGYRSPWSFEESQKNLLRTHTTAVSARLLYKLAQEGFKPVKYFSIDKVYRNETLDATHLAEFHQVEGVIADYDLSMKHLMGIFSAFFEKIGIKTLRFKPTYNPYTEPSMEMFTFHEGLNKWVEVGNSGYFRPEMLRTMGLPSNVTVAGWGLSLERPAMIKFGTNNIRDLLGSKVKMELILDNPICTIDKFGRNKVEPLDQLIQRQKNDLHQLCRMQAEITKLGQLIGMSNNEGPSGSCQLPSDIVIMADLSSPPYSIYPLVSLLSKIVPVSVNVHTHSSVQTKHNIDSYLTEQWNQLTTDDRDHTQKLKIVLVWKIDELTAHPTMNINPLSRFKVTGEVNIARYLCRLIESLNPKINLYENLGDQTVLIDYVLDSCHNALTPESSKKDVMAIIKSLSKIEIGSSYLCGNSWSVADLAFASTLRHLNLLKMYSKANAWCTHPIISTVFNGFKL